MISGLPQSSVVSVRDMFFFSADCLRWTMLTMRFPTALASMHGTRASSVATIRAWVEGPDLATAAEEEVANAHGSPGHLVKLADRVVADTS